MISNSKFYSHPAARSAILGAVAAAFVLACEALPSADNPGRDSTSVSDANANLGAGSDLDAGFVFDAAPGSERSDALHGEPCHTDASSDASCDARRGLRCVGERDGAAGRGACACAPGQTWSEDAGSCDGHRLGERPGDPCGPGGEGAVQFAPCNAHKGLLCRQPPRELVDAPPTCACVEGEAWVEARGRCLPVGAADGCGALDSSRAKRSGALVPGASTN